MSIVILPPVGVAHDPLAISFLIMAQTALRTAGCGGPGWSFEYRLENDQIEDVESSLVPGTPLGPDDEPPIGMMFRGVVVGRAPTGDNGTTCVGHVIARERFGDCAMVAIVSRRRSPPLDLAQVVAAKYGARS